MATNWDKDQPAGNLKVRLADDKIRANNAALEDALGRNHNFPGNEGSDAGEHSVVELQDQAGDKTQEAGLIKIWNNAGVLKYILPGGSAIPLVSVPSGEIILFEKDTAVAGYTLKTDKDDMVIYVTKGSGAGGEAGASDKSGGTWTQPNHTHGAGSYAGPSHTHTVDIYPSNYTGTILGLESAQRSRLMDTGTDVAWHGTLTMSSIGQHGKRETTAPGGTGSVTGTSGAGATANTWRPAGRNFTRQQRN